MKITQLADRRSAFYRKPEHNLCTSQPSVKALGEESTDRIAIDLTISGLLRSLQRSPKHRTYFERRAAVIKSICCTRTRLYTYIYRYIYLLAFISRTATLTRKSANLMSSWSSCWRVRWLLPGFSNREQLQRSCHFSDAASELSDSMTAPRHCLDGHKSASGDGCVMCVMCAMCVMCVRRTCSVLGRCAAHAMSQKC